MVLDYSLFTQCRKYAAERVRRLLDDAGVGNGIDHAAFVVSNRVVQSKCQAGECFAAAGRHGKREHAWGFDGFESALRQDVGAVTIHGCVISVFRQQRHMSVQRCLQGG